MRTTWRAAFFPDEPAILPPKVGPTAPTLGAPAIGELRSPEPNKPVASQLKVDPTVLSVSGPHTKVRRTPEFKKAAVELAYARGSITAAGHELGVPLTTLQKWVAIERKTRASPPSKFSLGSAEQLEIMRLRAELEKATIERDMLERATAFFARLSS